MLMAQRLRHRGPDGEGSGARRESSSGHRRLVHPGSDGGRPPADGAGRPCADVQRRDLQPRTAARGAARTLALERRHRSAAASPGAARQRLLSSTWSACLHSPLWDAGARRLLLARDRLGIKPLVLPDLAGRHRVRVGTQSAVACSASREIDRSAVRDYLFHGYIPAPKTIYRGIAKLPAGHTLTWQDGRVRIERYWSPSTAIEAAKRERHACSGWMNCCARSYRRTPCRTFRWAFS